MEFPHINLQLLFGKDVCVFTAETIARLSKRQALQMSAIIESLCCASARAQLPQKVPHINTNTLPAGHRVYIAARPPKLVVGFIRICSKQYTQKGDDGSMQEMTARCVQDFYVHESNQRCGVGLLLVQRLLEMERLQPDEVAYDRLTPRLQNLLRKYYGLDQIRPLGPNIITLINGSGGKGASSTLEGVEYSRWSNEDTQNTIVPATTPSFRAEQHGMSASNWPPIDLAMGKKDTAPHDRDGLKSGYDTSSDSSSRFRILEPIKPTIPTKADAFHDYGVGIVGTRKEIVIAPSIQFPHPHPPRRVGIKRTDITGGAAVWEKDNKGAPQAQSQAQAQARFSAPQPQPQPQPPSAPHPSTGGQTFSRRVGHMRQEGPNSIAPRRSFEGLAPNTPSHLQSFPTTTYNQQQPTWDASQDSRMPPMYAPHVERRRDATPQESAQPANPNSWRPSQLQTAALPPLSGAAQYYNSVSSTPPSVSKPTVYPQAPPGRRGRQFIL